MVDSTAGRDGTPDAGGPSLLEPALLELEGMTKRFPGVLALDAVPFDLRAGEVHVLFGENGAGKSTLISIVAGALRPESGTVKLRGEPICGLEVAALDDLFVQYGEDALGARIDARDLSRTGPGR